MTGRRWQWFLGIGLAGTIFSLGILLGLPFSLRAQQQPQPAATAPGRQQLRRGGDLQGLSRGSVQQVFEDQDGTPLPLPGAHARREERLRELPRSGQGPRGCGRRQGQGRAHHLREERSHARGEAERGVSRLPTKGARIFWKGSSPRVAQCRVHQLPHADAECLAEAPAGQGKRDRDLRHLPPAEAGPAMRKLAHAGPRGQDEVHLVPQPARHRTPALLKENSVNETCYTCHAEKRGPFLWEHAPVRESCAELPRPARHEQRRDAQARQAAALPAVPHRGPASVEGVRPPGTFQKFVMGRSCNDCHVAIHGSNHPAGFRLTR